MKITRRPISIRHGRLTFIDKHGYELELRDAWGDPCFCGFEFVPAGFNHPVIDTSPWLFMPSPCETFWTPNTMVHQEPTDGRGRPINGTWINATNVLFSDETEST